MADVAKECLLALQIICMSCVECGRVTYNFESEPLQFMFLLYVIFVEGGCWSQYRIICLNRPKENTSPKRTGRYFELLIVMQL